MEQQKERVRKEYASRGSRGQKMVSFRLDIENVEYLNAQPNKGRWLNNLIAAAQERASGEERAK